MVRPRMDRRSLEQHLSQVKADVAVRAKYIERLRQTVARLKAGNRRVAAARQSLQDAEENQAIFVAEADRLAKELAALPLGVHPT
jgi:septal ring factor EnvC (AmiA/AmiB activator)